MSLQQVIEIECDNPCCDKMDHHAPLEYTVTDEDMMSEAMGMFEGDGWTEVNGMHFCSEECHQEALQ